MQPDSFKFVYVIVKQKTEKAARAQVWPHGAGTTSSPPAPILPIEVWLPFSQCSPNLKAALRGQALVVGVNEWLVPNNGLEKYLTAGPATVLPEPVKAASPWETPMVAAKPAPIDWASMMPPNVPSVTEQKAAVPEFPWMRPDRIAGASAQPIAPESGQEPPDYDPLDDLL